MTALIVTKLHRADHGELEARVSTNGTTVPVSRRFGSWSIPAGRCGPEQHVLPPVARELQARARRFERGEGR